MTRVPLGASPGEYIAEINRLVGEEIGIRKARQELLKQADADGLNREALTLAAGRWQRPIEFWEDCAEYITDAQNEAKLSAQAEAERRKVNATD